MKNNKIFFGRTGLFVAALATTLLFAFTNHGGGIYKTNTGKITSSKVLVPAWVAVNLKAASVCNADQSEVTQVAANRLFPK